MTSAGLGINLVVVFRMCVYNALVSVIPIEPNFLFIEKTKTKKQGMDKLVNTSSGVVFICKTCFLQCPSFRDVSHKN